MLIAIIILSIVSVFNLIALLYVCGVFQFQIDKIKEKTGLK